MSRLPAAAVCLLLFCFGPFVRCLDEPFVAHRRPLDALFRSTASGQKHSGSGPALGRNGSGGLAVHESHGSLATDQHPAGPRQAGPFQPAVPVAALQHRGVFRRLPDPAGNHRRWRVDPGPDVFGDGTVSAYQRALPAIDIGVPGSVDDFAGHGGPPMDTVDLEPSLDNEIEGNPLVPGPVARPPAMEDRPNGGRMLESIDLIREQLERIKQEEDIDIKSNLLMKLLTELPEGPLPIVYIEDAAGVATNQPRTEVGDPEGDNDDDDDDDGEDDDDDHEVGRIVTEQFTPNGGKRSGRYYRRYPWKRQNARSRTYDAEARYLCVPSREDVFKLLVGLHENRIGNHQKTVNFCNRKRPAKAIFTNIRFLG